MLHVYFALRPEKRCYLTAMTRGWMSRVDYRARHDETLWKPESVPDCSERTPLMNADARAALDQTIDAIESSYEFMLAYAAQGRDQEDGGPDNRSARRWRPSRQRSARWLIASRRMPHPCRRAKWRSREFLSVARRDAAAARATLRLALATPAISSQLIDNLNASIHIRTLLTDVFLVDEALKALARAT